MRISDWSSDVCSSDLFAPKADQAFEVGPIAEAAYVSGQARGGRTKAAQQAHYPRKGRFALQQSASDEGVGERHELLARAMSQGQERNSTVEGKGVSVRVILGSRRIIQKKKKIQ